MKKRILTVTVLAIFSMMILNACNKKDEIINPTDINVNGKIISFYSNKENVEKVLGEGEITREENAISYDVGDEGDDGTLIIFYDEEGNINWINLLSSSIKTYNDISCYDDISKVTDAYQYEREINRKIDVLFDGNKEVEWKAAYDIADDQIYVSYFIRDDKVDGIAITDWKYVMKKE